MKVTSAGDPKLRAKVCELLLLQTQASSAHPIRVRDICWKLHIHPDDKVRHHVVSNLLRNLTKKLILSAEGAGRTLLYKLQDPTALTVYRDKLLAVKAGKPTPPTRTTADRTIIDRVNNLAERISRLAGTLEETNKLIVKLAARLESGDYFVSPEQRGSHV